MAEGETKLVDKAEDKTDNLECAVCLQSCIHPAQLPCGHIFCYLCIKGIANQSKRCAMCRQEIPRDFTDQPNLLNGKITEAADTYDGCYQWFYEGRNGWWQYDERTSKELETAYKAGERTCELLIAGFLYVSDLEAMLQLRRNDPSRRRRIKRDLATISKKGIAGLRTESHHYETVSDTITITEENTQREVELEADSEVLRNIVANMIETMVYRPQPQNSSVDVDIAIDGLQSLQIENLNDSE